MSDWQSEDVPSKRFQHKSRAGTKGRGRHGRKGNASEFKPHNMLGKYQVSSHTLEKLAGHSGEEMWFEIHQLVASDTAYLASFDFDLVQGVMIVAGSRRSLRDAITAIEKEASAESGEEEIEEQDDDGDQTGIADGKDDDTDFISAADLQKPGHAFEKNTFRNPKWFGQWRGRIRRKPSSSQQHDALLDNEEKHEAPEMAVNTHNAHLEFTTAACDEVHGTFTCPELGADNIAWIGRKYTGKASAAPFSWSEFDHMPGQ